MSRTAEIRALAQGDEPAALRKLADLLAASFGLQAREVAINRDQYSLNSLNGFFATDDGAFFFKFHQEEGEEAMSGEYYRAEILEAAGLPVDMPLYRSTEPGEQILIYRRRSDPRFSDVLRGLDLVPDEAAEALAVAAEVGLNRRLLQVSRDSLHAITAAQSAAEPIHRLFSERLVDLPGRQYPGGRLKSFYIGQRFDFPGASLDWAQLSTARVRVNGVDYADSIGALFDGSADLLRPEALARFGGVVAHGDAHNANVWYQAGKAGPELVFFDPAFAGENVPALLAEVKATFHNILAHPFWLYDPALAAEWFHAEVRYDGTVLEITTDYQPSRIRDALLQVKATEYWRPMLATLRDRGFLPDDWRATLRAALFCCPTLVMSLRAGGSHNATSSAIGFAASVMAGSEPLGVGDRISGFLDQISPLP